MTHDLITYPWLMITLGLLELAAYHYDMAMPERLDTVVSDAVIEELDTVFGEGN